MEPFRKGSNGPSNLGRVNVWLKRIRWVSERLTHPMHPLSAGDLPAMKIQQQLSAFGVIYIYTLWLFNIAMENVPIGTSIYKGFSMAMLNNPRVYILYYTIAWVLLPSSKRLHVENLPFVDLFLKGNRGFSISTLVYPKVLGGLPHECWS